MPTDTFSIADTNGDGGGWRQGTTYPPTGTYTDDSNSVQMLVGRLFSTPNYTEENAYMRWNTASIPDDATITDATLKIRVEFKSESEGYSFAGDYYDWGGAPSTVGDWVSDISSSIFTPITLSSLSTSAYTDITLTDLTGINLTGFTGIRLAISGTTPPTTTNQINIQTWQSGSTEEPKLVVTYTVPPPGVTAPQFTNFQKFALRHKALRK